MKKYWNHRVSFWLRVILLICGLLVNFSIVIADRNDIPNSDFAQDYIAAHSLRSGNSLYGRDITNLGNEMLGFDRILNFHPPFDALLFLPLSFLPYDAAFVIWGVLSILLLLRINHFIANGLELSGEWLLNLMCITLFWSPVFACLLTGQSSMIIAACVISGWFYLRSEKEYVAGFLFAIATLIKLFPGLILLYLVMSKNWRACFSMVSFIILGLAVTAFVVGVDDMEIYATTIVAKDVDGFSGFVHNHSISGIVARIFGEGTGWTEPLIQIPQVSILLIFLLNSSVLIYTVLKLTGIMVKEDFADYGIGLTIVAMLLLSPITWSHIFPVLILPISLLLREYLNEPSSRRLRLLLIILLFLSLPDMLIALGLIALHHPFRIPWYSALLTLGPSSGLLLLLLELGSRASIFKKSIA